MLSKQEIKHKTKKKHRTHFTDPNGNKKHADPNTHLRVKNTNPHFPNNKEHKQKSLITMTMVKVTDLDSGMKKRNLERERERGSKYLL